MYKLYKGSTLLKKVYRGSTPVKKIYKGSTLIWQDAPYDVNTVIFEQANPGTYQVNLLGAGSYEVYCVASGGRGGGFTVVTSHSRRTSYFGGGSGSAFVGIAKLPKGLLSITVGNNDTSRNSSIGNLIITYGGSNPYVTSPGVGVLGAGGAIPTINTQIVSQQINSRGNDGPRTEGVYNSGGDSLFNGYGKGGDGTAVPYGTGNSGQMVLNSYGTTGYVKIIYKGE